VTRQVKYPVKKQKIKPGGSSARNTTWWFQCQEYKKTKGDKPECYIDVEENSKI